MSLISSFHYDDEEKQKQLQIVRSDIKSLQMIWFNKAILPFPYWLATILSPFVSIKTFPVSFPILLDQFCSGYNILYILTFIFFLQLNKGVLERIYPHWHHNQTWGWYETKVFSRADWSICWFNQGVIWGIIESCPALG